MDCPEIEPLKPVFAMPEPRQCNCIAVGVLNLRPRRRPVCARSPPLFLTLSLLNPTLVARATVFHMIPRLQEW